MEYNVKTERLKSLDALRGFDMLFIMGAGIFFQGLAELFPTPFFQELALQMEHVGWDGLRLEDVIFPLFLFIAGVSFPFSLQKQLDSNMTKADIYKKIIRRGLTLVVLGIIYNGFLRELDFANQRYCSVLGRIGLAWMFAALIFLNTKLRTRVIFMISVLVGYWLLIAFIPAPDAPSGFGVFTKEGNIASYIDRSVIPGRLFKGIHDPEGIMGTLPAIVTALLGMLSGELLKLKNDILSGCQKAKYLLIGGSVLIIVGLIWNSFCPINKNLWSSSFVCTVGGISAILLCVFYYIIDVRKIQKWSFFFVVIGVNSITIYLAQEILDFKQITNFFFGGVVRMMPENAQLLIYSLGYIICCWLFLLILYRKRIFLKV